VPDRPPVLRLAAERCHASERDGRDGHAVRNQRRRRAVFEAAAGRGRRYIDSEKTGNGVASRTSVALTGRGRTALDTYTAALRDLLAGL
jgi:hypothetical protein